jgi:HPt (histidine-containing phosphotransfer) domain-containing protein
MKSEKPRAEKSLPIDWKILRTATDGDEAVIKEIISIYLREGPKNVKELRSAVASADTKQVAALAHRFLGSSRFFGATEIGKPLTALLKMARARRLSAKAAEYVNRAEKEFVRIHEFLKGPHD